MLAPDFIVPFPYTANFELGNHDGLRSRLSVLSQMAVESAVYAWRQHPAADIVMAGETAYPSDTLPNTTDLMLEYAKMAGVPERNLVGLYSSRDGSYLNNTTLQAQAIEAFIAEKEDGDPNILALGLEFHVPRIRQTLEAAGLSVEVEAVEDMLHRAGISDYDGLIPYITPEFGGQEKLLLFLGRINPAGTLLNAVTKLRGARLADIEVATTGEPVLYTGRAITRLRQLQQEAGSLSVSGNQETIAKNPA